MFKTQIYDILEDFFIFKNLQVHKMRFEEKPF